MSSSYQLTPEQIALQQERKRKKELAKQAAPSIAPVEKNDAGKILTREWVQLRDPRAGFTAVKVMTWNMLAQTLVRRDLFPSSDCLRGSQREHMLPREITTYAADIVCLQEVDRLDKLLLPLESAGYAHTYATGRAKKHGCMILHRESKFRKVAEKVVYLDEEPVGREGKTGGTRRTKNISLIVALEAIDGDQIPSGSGVSSPKGCLVATCHLFWHPQFKYERTRQTAIILREIYKIQEQYPAWPVFFAGDFNSQPTEVAYALLTGTPLSARQIAEIEASRVMHVSLDPSITPTNDAVVRDDDDDEGGATVAVDKDGGGENEKETDPDRVFTNTRRAIPSDGLLTTLELFSFFPSPSSPSSPVPHRIRSAYDTATRHHLLISERDNIFSARPALPSSAPTGPAFAGDPQRKPGEQQGDEKFSFEEEGNVGVEKWGEGETGAYEPMWTSFTHFWRLTLDYIFILDPRIPISDQSHPSTQPAVIGLLKTHRTPNLEPGLPRLGVCGSDHIALVVEVEF